MHLLTEITMVCADAVDGDADNDNTAENTAGALIITGPTATVMEHPIHTQGPTPMLMDYRMHMTSMPTMMVFSTSGKLALPMPRMMVSQMAHSVPMDGATRWMDSTTLDLPDTDGDGIADNLDIDADNDGIVDNIEGQSTAGYIAPAGSDADNDGIDNAYDNDDAAFGGNANNGISPNADATMAIVVPDYIDLDTDADGKTDRLEGWDTDGNGVINGGEIAFVGTTDADNDGLLDEYDADDVNPEPTNGTTPASYPDVNNPGDDRDWRQSGDSDADGILDIVDTDDDNDGIPDAIEGTADTDSDGRPDSRDLDSDNDGISDLGRSRWSRYKR